MLKGSLSIHVVRPDCSAESQLEIVPFKGSGAPVLSSPCPPGTFFEVLQPPLPSRRRLREVCTSSPQSRPLRSLGGPSLTRLTLLPFSLRGVLPPPSLEFLLPPEQARDESVTEGHGKIPMMIDLPITSYGLSLYVFHLLPPFPC